MRAGLVAAGIAMAVAGLARAAGAEESAQKEPFPPPVSLSLLPDEQSVYAPPAPPREDEGLNAGGVNFDLTFRYVTDNIYRGVSRTPITDHPHSPNYQFDGRMTFNLGKFPHPFIGTFVNVHSSDPVSRFQEVRPYYGLEWNLRPFIVEGGGITYIFPERDGLNTGEVYAKITFDDSWLFNTDTPIVSPYVFAAYDYDKYQGYYFEAGIKHDFVFEGTGFTLTAQASIAYVLDNPYYATTLHGRDTGLQHYELGLIGSYSLNHFFHFSPRYGTFTLNGYLYYDDRTTSDLRSDIEIWGGAGIGFRY
ncbi:MAG TPA: hypothetical protein VH475_10445 [Tepidisphaeraceae bacterium]